MIPPAVASELSHIRTPAVVQNWITAPPYWLEIRAPLNIDATLQIDDRGELEAISLALEIRADFLLVDDRKARRAATERGLSITGVIGVLDLAAVRGLLNLPDAFDRLRRTDFRVAERILRVALQRDADRTPKS